MVCSWWFSVLQMYSVKSVCRVSTVFRFVISCMQLCVIIYVVFVSNGMYFSL